MRAKIFFVVVVFLCGYVSLGLCEEEKWREHKSRHFIVYYQEAPEDFIETVERNAERYYQVITRNLGYGRNKSWTWDERCNIYIYNDAEHYVSAAKQANWSHGAAWVRTKTIRSFPSAHGFFDSTLPHELGHIVFREFVGFHADVPLWFEEGIAMYQEEAKRWGANKIVRQAIEEKTFIPLKELSRMRLSNRTANEVVQLYYAESASAVYYLITECGEYRFVKFCRKLKEGRPFENALHSVYSRFDSIDDLNRSWIKYLKK